MGHVTTVAIYQALCQATSDSPHVPVAYPFYQDTFLVLKVIIMLLKNEVFLKLYLFPYFICMYVSRCTYIHYMCAGCHGSQKRAFEVNGNDEPLCGC